LNVFTKLVVFFAIAKCSEAYPPYGQRYIHYMKHSGPILCQRTRGQDSSEQFPTQDKTPFQPTHKKYNPPPVIGIPTHKETEARYGDGEFRTPKPQSVTTECPAGSGIYNKTGECYKFAMKLATDEPSPCGPLMDFYHSNTNPRYGECDCKDRVLGRPTAYWRATDECHLLFDQGPCPAGDWLVLGDDGSPVCNKRSCERVGMDSTNFWFRYRGKCYLSGSTDSEACASPDLKVYYTLVKGKYTIECRKIDIIETKNLLNGAKPLPCLPGHKESATGECRQVATFE